MYRFVLKIPILMVVVSLLYFKRGIKYGDANLDVYELFINVQRFWL